MAGKSLKWESNVSLICTKCGKPYEIKYTTYNARLKHGSPQLCPECMKIRRSEDSKNYWKREDNWWTTVSPEEKKERLSKAWEGNKKFYSNLSKEEKEKRTKHALEGYEKWRECLTDEEWNERNAQISESLKKYQATQPHKPKVEKVKHVKVPKPKPIKVKKERVNYWDYMPKEEKDRRMKYLGEKSVENWNNMTEEEKRQKISKINAGHKKWWNELDDEKKLLVSERMSKVASEWWASLTPEEREKKLKNQSNVIHDYWQGLTSEEYQIMRSNQAKTSNNLSKRNFIQNKLEIEVANHFNLQKLSFDIKWYNETKHPDFDKLFSKNPVTDSIFISPYHEWDFILRLKDRNVLVDVDGSVHDKSQTNYMAENNSKKIVNVYDYVAFNDSKRPYQTDGMDAYVIQCYDDKLSPTSKVLNVKTNESMTFKQFIALMKFIDSDEKRKEEMVCYKLMQ